MRSAIDRDSIQHAQCVAAFLALCAAALLIFAGCTGSVTTEVQGDRDVVMVTTGHLKNGQGDGKRFFIIRDKDTGVDYLAVIDAGIIKLEPKPAPAVEAK
jgi:hypothetical protein